VGWVGEPDLVMGVENFQELLFFFKLFLK